MLFDPVINSAFSDDIRIFDVGSLSKPLVCSHCHKPIKSRLYQSGENFYDEYCWQFKFVIDPLYLQRASRRDIKKFDDDGTEIH